eukprot:2137379-Prorocentrum_lima.AAC.1
MHLPPAAAVQGDVLHACCSCCCRRTAVQAVCSSRGCETADLSLPAAPQAHSTTSLLRICAAATATQVRCAAAATAAACLQNPPMRRTARSSATG